MARLSETGNFEFPTCERHAARVLYSGSVALPRRTLGLTPERPRVGNPRLPAKIHDRRGAVRLSTTLHTARACRRKVLGNRNGRRVLLASSASESDQPAAHTSPWSNGSIGHFRKTIPIDWSFPPGIFRWVAQSLPAQWSMNSPAQRRVVLPLRIVPRAGGTSPPTFRGSLPTWMRTCEHDRWPFGPPSGSPRPAGAWRPWFARIPVRRQVRRAMWHANSTWSRCPPIESVPPIPWWSRRFG